MTTNPHYRRWTDAELQFIRDHLGEATVKQIAQKLNRSVFATKTKVYDLGLAVRIQRQAYRAGEHADSLVNHPVLGHLMVPIHQPRLPRNRWSAFDELRALFAYGAMDDEQLAGILNRSVSALVTQRYVHRWNMAKARHLRLMLTHNTELRDTLDELRESGEPRIPGEFLEPLLWIPYQRSTPRTSAGSCKPSSTVSTSN